MSLLDCASGKSVWRGYEYYKQNKVISVNIIDDYLYECTVKGTDSYHIKMDVNHPRKSSCDCPHAKGKRIICKHIVAAYFKVFPEEAENYYKMVVEQREEYERYQEELEERVIDFVHKMKKSELQEELLSILFNSEEWIYNRFVRENNLDYDN